MSLKIEIVSETGVEDAADLSHWLHQERIRDLIDITQDAVPPGPGEQGPTLLAVLTVVLGSAAVVKLAESVHVWIQTRNAPTKIKITDGDRIIEIETSRLTPLPDWVESSVRLDPE